MTLTLRQAPGDYFGSLLNQNGLLWNQDAKAEIGTIFPLDFGDLSCDALSARYDLQLQCFQEVGLSRRSAFVCASSADVTRFATEIAPPFALAVVAREGLYERVVTSVEDLPLAWSMVSKRALAPVAVLESASRGAQSSVYLAREGGQDTAHGVIEHTLAPEPFRHSVANVTAMAVDAGDPRIEGASQALDALGLLGGVARVDFMEVGDGLDVRFVDTCGLALGLPVDLLALAGNRAFANNAVRSAVDLSLEAAAPLERAVALCWLPIRSGHVVAPPRLEALLAQPGVVAAEVYAAEGAHLRHAVDGLSARQVGYVAATGATPVEAAARAQRAATACPVETEKILYG